MSTPICLLPCLDGVDPNFTGEIFLPLRQLRSFYRINYKDGNRVAKRKACDSHPTTVGPIVNAVEWIREAAKDGLIDTRMLTRPQPKVEAQGHTGVSTQELAGHSRELRLQLAIICKVLQASPNPIDAKFWKGVLAELQISMNAVMELIKFSPGQYARKCIKNLDIETKRAISDELRRELTKSK